MIEALSVLVYSLALTMALGSVAFFFKIMTETVLGIISYRKLMRDEDRKQEMIEQMQRQRLSEIRSAYDLSKRRR